MRRRHGRRRDERGVTVVELTVAAAVGSLLLAVAAAAFVGALRTVRVVDVSSSSVADARLAMEAMTRTLRVAYKPHGTPGAVLEAQPHGVRFWALLNRSGAPSTEEPAATLVEYGYDGTCVTETQTRAGAVVRTCLVRTALAPTFTYYASGAGAAGSSGAVLPAAPAVAAADLTEIRSIQVALTVRPAGDTGGVPVINRVTLVNLATAQG